MIIKKTPKKTNSMYNQQLHIAVWSELVHVIRTSSCCWLLTLIHRKLPNSQMTTTSIHWRLSAFMHLCQSNKVEMRMSSSKSLVNDLFVRHCCSVAPKLSQQAAFGKNNWFNNRGWEDCTRDKWQHKWVHFHH